MSYDRSYRGKRRYRDDYEDRRRDIVESPQEILRNAIIRLGEVDPIEELPRLEQQIRALVPPVISNLSEAFHIGVTEQPYKIPFYAALLQLLHEKKEDEDDPGKPSLGRQILEDFWKGFQAYLDKLSWRETRLCIHFFAHLAVANIVSPESMISLLQNTVAVLDEFGVSHGRAKRAALCTAEGLMIAGTILKTHSSTRVTELINTIQSYTETTASSKWIVQPMMTLHKTSASLENADEILDILLSSLRVLDEANFTEETESYVRPYTSSPTTDTFTPFDLPTVLVPPEVIELDGLSTDSGEDSQVKKEEWPEFYIRLFDNDITPDPNTPGGYAVRSALHSIVDIFEVNRKECARLLLEYPKWTHPGTFKPRPGGPSDIEPIPGKDWQLESTIIEILLGSYLLLPESPHKSIYYPALITELCKLSPSTVGPAVGKSIRRLYSSLSDGLDVECARRFAEWFAVHMSNFGFQWVWKEWIPDLALSTQHPRRSFVRRALEFEIRLSYYERIAKTLPDEMQSPEAETLPAEAPGPGFEYEDPMRPYHDAAQSVLTLLRGRSDVAAVTAHIESLKSSLESSDEEGHVNVDAVVRSITIQSLLHIGSRSFSHLLNAIERYLPLLRTLGGPSDVLTAASSFWRKNGQMVGIVFDKLMQYQIVDPTDVVDWVFAGVRREGGMGSKEWDILKAAVDKANGRVIVARKKVTALRKEEEEKRERVMASAGDMEVDTDVKPEEPAEESPLLTSSLKAFNSLTKQQKAALSRTLEGFVSFLAPTITSTDSNPETRTVLTEKAWHNRANWGAEEWNAYETWGWYRQFCRAYAPYLRNYVTTLSTVSFARFEGDSDPAGELLQKIWNVATGQEA